LKVNPIPRFFGSSDNEGEIFPIWRLFACTTWATSFICLEEYFSGKGDIREGLVWWVGNGEHIRIWVDKWLSPSSSNRIRSHVRVLELVAIVSALIDPVSNL
jgi:hypothetical protein